MVTIWTVQNIIALSCCDGDTKDNKTKKLEKVTKTDVLVGVHGAGMVHTMFMEPNSAVVEIFPPRLEYPVYRNLAKLKGVNYFSTHATKAGVSVDQGEDWHSSDLEMREEHFLEVISLAVKSVFNRGILNIDVWETVEKFSVSFVRVSHCDYFT